MYCLASDPVVCTDTSGNFYISAISIDEKGIDGIVTVYKSTNHGATFEANEEISTHKRGKFFDDKEFMCCDYSPSSPNRNSIYVTWTRYGQKDSSAQILISSTTDEGNTWTSPTVVINPPPPDFGSGSMPATGPHGEVYVTYAGIIKGIYGLYISKSTDGGITFGNTELIDTASYPGLPSIAIDNTGGIHNGYIYIVWAPFYEKGQDILLKCSSDRGSTWSESKKVNAGSPEDKFYTQPFITVDEFGRLNIIYYSSMPEDGTFNKVYLAVSYNGGRDFKNRLLNSILPEPGSRNFGHYIGIDSWNQRTIPVWTDNRDGLDNSDIFTAVVNTGSASMQFMRETVPPRYVLKEKTSRHQEEKLKISLNILKQSFVKISMYDLFGRKTDLLLKRKNTKSKYEIQRSDLQPNEEPYTFKIVTFPVITVKQGIYETRRFFERKVIPFIKTLRKKL